MRNVFPRMAVWTAIVAAPWASPAVHAQGTVLEFVEVLFDGANGSDGLNGAASVTLSPDGAQVYVASANESAVAVFDRDAGAGGQTFVEALFNGVNGVDGLAGPYGVTVSPDGAHVYVASWWDSALAVFSRDASTGKLTFVEALRDAFFGGGTVIGLGGPRSVTVSPDGAHVYVASDWDSATVVLSRDTETGRLTFVETLFDGVNGATGLGGAHDVTASPDGAHIYVASLNSAVAVFSRDAGTGRLTFIEALFDGVNGVDGLAGARAVTVSPDGANVYVAGYDDGAVAVFSRDAGTGRLSFLEVLLDGVNGADGLGGSHDVAVSPDGTRVYAVGFGDAAVVVFDREPGTGRLTFVEALFDGVNGVDGLLGARSVTVSTDGAHLYVASLHDHAVVTLRRRVVGLMRGQVVPAGGGAGLPCAALELATPGRTAVYRTVTDRNGEYSFINVPAGQYGVRVISPGFGDVTLDNLLLTAATVLEQDFAMPPGTGQPEVAGLVTEGLSGLPLAGVRVEALIGGNPVASTYTCATGGYEVDLPGFKGTATPVELRFTLDGYVSETQTVAVVPGETAIANQLMEKAIVGAATLYVLVVDASGAPLPNVQVTLTGGAYLTSWTNANGIAGFDALPGGSYTVRVSAVGLGGATDQRFLSGGNVVFSTLALAANPVAPLPGDVNGDSLVNAVDIQLVINAALGSGALGATDVNGDGKVDAVDIQLTINAALGLL